MNIFKYLKRKYRRFISTSLDEETNYQSLNLEQSKKIANTITISIIGLSGLTFVWLIFAKTDQIVIANGELQPTTRVRSIKLPISGVVEEVYVEEGNLVDKDEKLIKINDDLNIETKQNLINKISLKEEELKLKKSELENSVLILKNEINEINSVLSIERDNLNKFSALLLYKPIVLICCLISETPNLTMSSGVEAFWNSFFVALFTLMSVACADNTTATRSVNEFIKVNSDFG